MCVHFSSSSPPPAPDITFVRENGSPSLREGESLSKRECHWQQSIFNRQAGGRAVGGAPSPFPLLSAFLPCSPFPHSGTTSPRGLFRNGMLLGLLSFLPLQCVALASMPCPAAKPWEFCKWEGMASHNTCFAWRSPWRVGELPLWCG